MSEMELAGIPGAVVRSWDELVAEGRQAIDGFQWKLGDLAGEVETSYGEASLAAYAAEIDVNYTTLGEYRRVASLYEIPCRQGISFTVAQVLAAQPDRLDLVASQKWTAAQARELVASRRAIPAPPAPAPAPAGYWEPSSPPAPFPFPQPADGPPPVAPLWGSEETRAAEVVQCAEGHLAARETFEDVGGCPYCLHTPGERQAALKAREALLRRLQSNPVVAEERGGGGAPRPAAHVAYNAGDNEWYTPADYIKAAKAVMGDVDLDPASSEVANSVVGAYRFYTEADDGLSKPWSGRVWMNPPYAQPLVAQFAERLLESFAAGDVTEACVLVNNATETAWCSGLIAPASAICLPRGRIKFWHPRKESAPLQGQIIIYLGPRPADFRAEFRQFGPVKGEF